MDLPSSSLVEGDEQPIDPIVKNCMECCQLCAA